MAAVNLRSDFADQEKNSVTASTFSHSICHEVMRLDAMIIVFQMLNFKPAFFTLLFLHYISILHT